MIKYKRNDTNFGIELEITNGFLFDSTIAATISNEKLIFANLFDIERKKFNLTYVGVEQKIREALLLCKNVKVLFITKRFDSYIYQRFRSIATN
jgi:hypothetical protein